MIKVNDDKELVRKLRDSDIVKVYMPIDVSDIRDLFDTDKLKVIYERVEDNSNKNDSDKIINNICCAFSTCIFGISYSSETNSFS